MTASIACPHCGTGLREYRGRLVCDACTGMLITDEDLLGSLGDLVVKPISIDDPEEVVDCPACPRCAREMVSARIQIGTTNVFGGPYVGGGLRSGGLVRVGRARNQTFARCSEHGFWFGPGELAGLFARINSATHLHSSGKGYGGVGNYGQGASGLWISERRGPRTVTPFVSALANTTLVCPRCTDELHLHHDHWACDLCHGVFVEQVALEAMIVEMTHAPWRLEPSSGPSIGRRCPACGQAMTAETIEEVGVARCSVHGVWFDAPNLATVLENASTATHGSALGNWLRRSFRRV